MRSPTIVADGSAEADGPGRVVVDRSDPATRWRFVCPNGHTDWDPTNSHLWCASCAALHGVDPEYYELLDKKHDESIPWSAVVLR